MAYAYNDAERFGLTTNNDEQRQDNAVLTNTAADIGATTPSSDTAGTSPQNQPQAQQAAPSQVMQRNLGRARSPFDFNKTRQALTGARTAIDTEKNTYLANAATPYAYNAQTTQAVQNWARGTDKTPMPSWMSTFQAASPAPMEAFTSKTPTNFASVNALKTNAGVRNYLRDPLDPEARSGEQALDFSILNSNPQFNLDREGVLKDYSDLVDYQNRVGPETSRTGRIAQNAAFDAYKRNIANTLDSEAKAISDASQAAETAYDKGYEALPGQMQSVVDSFMQEITAQAPEALRPYIKPIDPSSLSGFFNPLTADITRPEDFLTADQASNFNRIMGVLGRGGSMPTAGRLAGKSGPTADDLQFDKNAFRDAIMNQAQAAYMQELTKPQAPVVTPTPAPPPPPQQQPIIAQAGQLAIDPGDTTYAALPPMDPNTPYVESTLDPVMAGQLAIPYSHGGRVPGEAPQMGDSPENDIVDAKLSPGEIVIPRSAAGDKESAKKFLNTIPFSKTRDLLKTKYNCGGMVGKGYADGGRVDMDAETQKLYDAQYNAPIPGAKDFKQGVDDALTEYVVDPLAKRGYENLGAGLATVPSTIMEALVPNTAGDALMAITPFPKIKGMFKRGTSEALSKAEPPKVPQFETVKKPYDEKMLDPAEQTVQKVLAALENENLTAEQKQALADYVRVNYKLNNYISAQRNFQHQFPNQMPGETYNLKLLEDMFEHNYPHPHEGIDDNWQNLHKAFGGPQGLIKGRDPRVQKMMDILRENEPFGARDTILDRAKDLQYQMYKGRPSAKEEFEKYGKTKEVLQKKPKKQGRSYTQGKYKIHDWAGNEMSDFGTFDSFDDAYEYLVAQLEKKYSGDELDEILGEFSVVERNAKKQGGR